jgi:hypothetical protein
VPNVPLAHKSCWTHPMELLIDVGHVKSHFSLSRDSVSEVQDRWMVCAKCTIGSEVVLDTPNGTPR